jgi:hypothetical protein
MKLGLWPSRICADGWGLEIFEDLAASFARNILFEMPFTALHQFLQP